MIRLQRCTAAMITSVELVRPICLTGKNRSPVFPKSFCAAHLSTSFSAFNVGTARDAGSGASKNYWIAGPSKATGANIRTMNSVDTISV